MARPGRVTELDILRFAAALAVVFYHLTYNTVLHPVTRFGYLGVDFFFMISGFVILWSAHGRTPTEFAISRFARLYPAYWLCLFITIGATWVFERTLPTVDQVAANMTMVAGYLGKPFIDAVYWTLAVELKFYFLVFWVLVFRRMESVEKLVYFWIILCAADTLVGLPAIVRTIIVAPYGILFGAGALFFLIRTRGVSRARLAGVVACAIMAVPYGVNQSQAFLDGDTSRIPAFVLVGLFVIMGLIATNRLRIQPRAWITTLSALTYPLYLLHGAIGKPLAGSIGVPIALIAVMLAAYVANAIDRPIARRVRRGLMAWAGKPGIREGIVPAAENRVRP